ncbi:MAG TPA: class I SAM-dependent methyltransferase [Candidatus Dojkabacteria bacterium]|nr:class I SAM-dependent methyltransferase [Candidatus Dojkabacteria bacterium]
MTTNDKTDAYGKYLLDAYNGKNPTQIIERDDGHTEKSQYSPAYFSEFKDWPHVQQEAIQFTQGKVLDIGAGAGRVSMYLQDKGHEVTAIDNSPLAVEVCKKRGVKDARVIPIEEINILNGEKFDTVVLFGLGLGLLGNKELAQKTLERLHQITSEHARIIGDGLDPYQTDDPEHLNYHKFNTNKGRMPGQVRIKIKAEDYESDWIEYLLTSQLELEDLLKKTGWKVEKHFSANDPTYAAVITKT